MKKLSLEATVANIGAVTAFVEEALEAAGCPMKAMMQINVAIDELFGNIARYAYKQGTGMAEVDIDIDEAAREVRLTFIDSGIPFDPLAVPDPDVTGSAQERALGGLGIFMVRRSMDGMAYRREGGRNILTIRKRF